MIFLPTCTSHQTSQQDTFHEKPKPKCNKNKYKNCQILKLQRKMKQKLKYFHANYIHSILMFVSNIEIPHCTLLKIVYIIQV
jgi:hypothetical protein